MACGYANVIARSDDGVAFETVAEFAKERFGAISLERPALVVTPDGRWRLYVSCATRGTKHWRVDLLEADTPERLARAPARTVLPGDPDSVAVKDPVLVRRDGRWHLWASCHPLDDRMTTEYATSTDGIEWCWRGTVLRSRAGAWDARGVRITAVVFHAGLALALYDGRATAEENWEERTGVAVATVRGGARAERVVGSFLASGDRPVAQSPHGTGGLRYVAVVDVGEDRRRLYYEADCGGGSHDIRTELVTRAIT
jgi:hypothetical protein